VYSRNTSKQCSRCGTMVEKSLSVRVHVCPVCGLVMDRDENAANNILRLGLESLGFALEAPAFTPLLALARTGRRGE
jgi:putative transposase